MYRADQFSSRDDQSPWVSYASLRSCGITYSKIVQARPHKLLVFGQRTLFCSAKARGDESGSGIRITQPISGFAVLVVSARVQPPAFGPFLSRTARVRTSSLRGTKTGGTVCGGVDRDDPPVGMLRRPCRAARRSAGSAPWTDPEEYGFVAVDDVDVRAASVAYGRHGVPAAPGHLPGGEVQVGVSDHGFMRVFANTIAPAPAVQYSRPETQIGSAIWRRRLSCRLSPSALLAYS